MAKAKPIAASVLAELEALAPKKQTWFDRLDADAKSKLQEVRRLWQANQCNYAKRTIHQLAKQYGAKVCAARLGEWLDAKE